ncbi:MoxR-like ATPase [Desulfomonile tiedjei DSM 6799]|uniref:MoxR-like ATPase n=2 Tax=Desulfomonile tiedjei TaxID=2358 RepID=I4C8E2_DESTA|nr:MoxR-like ATPase [Desulfomonile tiedjei DSM 6799]
MRGTENSMFDSIESLQQRLLNEKYIPDRSLATVLYLAWTLKKPLFLEGEPGVGKTETAAVMARVLGTELIRLQCYEGLDANHALYEWNYPRQILAIKLGEQCGTEKELLGKTIFTEEFLIKRPLLEAILSARDKEPVLLIDEIDRSDEEFEALLLEVLSDFQISIPEIGTLKAVRKPLVILTSNRTRDIHDALKRRCLYHWIDYPTPQKEREIISARMPAVSESLALQVALFMQRLRSQDFLKRPGVAESLDWAAALLALDRTSLDEETIQETLGCILKYREDLMRFHELWNETGFRQTMLTDVLEKLC